MSLRLHFALAELPAAAPGQIAPVRWLARCLLTPDQARARALPPAIVASKTVRATRPRDIPRIVSERIASPPHIGLVRGLPPPPLKSETNGGRMLGTPRATDRNIAFPSHLSEPESCKVLLKPTECGPFRRVQGPKWRCRGAQVTPRPPGKR